MVKRYRPFMSGTLIVLTIAALTTACFNNTQPKGNDTTAAKKETTGGAAEDRFSLEADNKLIEQELAKVTTPDLFKNTPAFEYLFEMERTPEPNAFGSRYFEKKFNVKPKYVGLGPDKRQEQLNMMFATGTSPDLVLLTQAAMLDYAKQGLLAEVPIDLIRKHMPMYTKTLEENSPDLLKITQVDGKNMGIARFNVVGEVARPTAIRADWLKNVGINKVPSTIDELEQAFVKFRNDDPDKNGKKDTHALSNGSDDPGTIWFQSIFGAYGTNPFIWLERNGKLQFGMTTQETKEALKRLQKWHEMELIDPEFITGKGNSANSNDVVTKFSKAKIGFLDNLSYTHHQWDNDGRLSLRWVASHPEWQKFFEENKNDPAKVYATKVFTDFDDKVPQPIYLTVPPVKGPNGQSGIYREGSNLVLALGKQMENDPAKLEKLLKMLDFLHSDKETYIKLGWGPTGIVYYEKEGELIFNPEVSKHALFNTTYTKLGTNWASNPMYFSSPEHVGAVGGPRSKQRFEGTQDIVKKFPAYENKLKGVLPSQSQYAELVDVRIKEYITKAIAGDVDIDKTFDSFVQKWYADGGTQLTNEANEWYQNFKR